MLIRLPLWIAALWWGSLSTIGFIVVPMLFAHLPSAAVAGNMAGKLFSAQTWITLACGLLLLMVSRPRGESVLLPWAKHALGWIITGMLLALILEFGVAPHILARENLKLWHSLGSLMFIGQWLCAGAVLWRASSPATAYQS